MAGFHQGHSGEGHEPQKITTMVKLWKHSESSTSGDAQPGVGALPLFGQVKLLKQMLLLIAHPTLFKLLFFLLQQLLIKPDWVPASHDVVGDDTAQGVGHDGDFASLLLELWVAGAEEGVEPVQLLLQPLHQLWQQGRERKVKISILSLLLMHALVLHRPAPQACLRAEQRRDESPAVGRGLKSNG